MPKATISFLLPDEIQEYKHAINGDRWMRACWELDSWLKNEFKRKKNLKIEDIREKLCLIMKDKGVEFE